MIEPTKESVFEFAEQNWLVCQVCGRRTPDVQAHASLCGFQICKTCDDLMQITQVAAVHRMGEIARLLRVYPILLDRRQVFID